MLGRQLDVSRPELVPKARLCLWLFLDYIEAWAALDGITLVEELSFDLALL